MGTRYSKGDKIRFSAKGKDDVKAEVVDIENPDSDSPDYIVEEESGLKGRVKASMMTKIEGEEADPTVFEETNITEKKLLGTHMYENVLYTGESQIVDVRTGKTPDRLDRSVEEAKQFAEEQSDDVPYVAKKRSQERQAERGSPYSASAFFNYQITGSMDWHKTFNKAWDSQAYEIDVNPNYNTGNLKVTVRKAD